ncbi:A1 phospholipase [Aureococcus anophagefferens]|uniref:A1 phospholipase n=1 Tax=Aureococcus anophagefferens TaxID=44056 RepID=A0ABR1FI56_AURAN
MSFSDAEGEIAVVEFTILDAHDAAMALSLVRAALALTKHASAVVGVVAVHGERGGTALAYLESSRARGGLAPASVALAPWENGGDAPAWRLALHVALAVRSLGDGAAAAVDREDREAALHAFHERAHPAAGRRGWDAPTPAKFDREREKWSLDAAGPPAASPSTRTGAGWQHCYAVAKVRLSRSDWLALHEARARHGAAAEDGEDLAALTDPAGGGGPSYARASSRRSRPRAAAGARAAARRRGAPSAPPPRGTRRRRARARRPGFRLRASSRRADFGAGRPFGAAIEAKLGVHAVRHDGSRLHGCRGAAELPQTRELLRHELAPRRTSRATTRRAASSTTSRPRARARDADQEALDAAAEAARLALVDDAAALVAARARAAAAAGATLWARLDGRGRTAGASRPWRRRPRRSARARRRRAAELAEGALGDGARRRLRSGRKPELNVALAPTRRMKGLDTWRAVRWLGAQHPRRVSLQPPVLFEYYAEALADVESLFCCPGRGGLRACFDWVRSVCGRGAFAAALADRRRRRLRRGRRAPRALRAATPSTANRRAIAALLRLGADPLAAAGPPAAFGSDADGDDDEAARGGPLFALGVAFESSNDGAARARAPPAGVAGAERPTPTRARDLHIDAVAGRGDARLDFYTPVIRLVKNAKDMGLRPVEIRPLNYIDADGDDSASDASDVSDAGDDAPRPRSRRRRPRAPPGARARARAGATTTTTTSRRRRPAGACSTRTWTPPSPRRWARRVSATARAAPRRARARCSDDWPDACAFAPDSPAASTPPRSPDARAEEPPDIDGGDDDELPLFAPAEDRARAGGDDEELPSAAILRGAKVDQLIVYLCRLARRRTGGAPATVRDFGYLEKKEAADVLQKTIFHFWMLYSGPASLVNDPFFPPSVEQMSEHAARAARPSAPRTCSGTARTRSRPSTTA